MNYLLAPSQRPLLDGLARGRTLFAFDFDGTLAPITADRDTAQMRPTTRVLLRRLCARQPTAILSGRSLADLTARLHGVGPTHLSGNHGIEPSANLDDYAREIAAARSWLEPRLNGHGIDLEDKTYSLALHYRGSREPQVTERAILDLVATLPAPLRVVPGKFVVNLLPLRAPNKGDALLQLIARTDASAALYVGDDATDEDVFAHDRPGALVTVCVGRSSDSAASSYLRSQDEIDDLLALVTEGIGT